MVSTTKAKMTLEQATQFTHVSPINAAIVSHSLACGCKPYKDVFTYTRWQAQGYQVRRGEHSIKLSVVKQVEFESEFGEIETKKIFANSHVFCRCQVDQKNGHKAATIITPAIIVVPPTPKQESKPEEADDNLMKGWAIV